MDDQAPKGLPRGRPRKDTNTLRTEWLKARVTPEELHRAEQRMRDAGMTPSDFIRDAVLNGQVVIKQYRQADPYAANQISRLGNLFNQYVRICNTTGQDRRAAYIDEIIEEDIRPLLKLMLEQYTP
jgi:hypothetical protein